MIQLNNNEWLTEEEYIKLRLEIDTVTKMIKENEQ